VVLTKFFLYDLIVKVIYPGTKERFYVRVERCIVFRCCCVEFIGFFESRYESLHFVDTMPDPAYCYHCYHARASILLFQAQWGPTVTWAEVLSEVFSLRELPWI